MQIDWWTLILQGINFLILVWLLWRFLFHPVKEIIARRKALADAASGKLEETRKEVEEQKRHYEEARQQLAKARRQLNKKMHDELVQEREKVLEEARKEADRMIQDARDQIDDERKSTIQSLRGEIAELAAGMAAHFLEQTSPDTYSNLLLEQISSRLEQLPAEERRQLEADLEGDDTVITITTAKPLDEARRREWTEKLQTLLDTPVSIDFASDPELIAGAVLSLPHAKIAFSWADQIKTAREILTTQ